MTCSHVAAVYLAQCNGNTDDRHRVLYFFVERTPNLYFLKVLLYVTLPRFTPHAVTASGSVIPRSSNAFFRDTHAGHLPQGLTW
jgi:hypothetical protein